MVHFAFWQGSHYYQKKINSSIRPIYRRACFPPITQKFKFIISCRLLGGSRTDADVRLRRTDRYAKLNSVKLQSQATVKIIHRPFVSGRDRPADNNALLPRRRAWKLKLFKFSRDKGGKNLEILPRLTITWLSRNYRHYRSDIIHAHTYLTV